MSVSQGIINRGKKIADSGGVVEVTKDEEWNVKGTRDTYSITVEGAGFLCEKLDQDDSRKLCVGWQFNGGEKVDRSCKHIEAVKKWRVQNDMA